MSGLYTPALEAYRALIDDALPRRLPRPGPEGDTALHRAMRYAVEAGGKRLRPVLTLTWCAAAGADPQSALDAACAVEYLHTYSLIHDDLPCMDNSPLRRGKPSVHAAFGEATALLAGDALLTHAFALVEDEAARCLAAAAGAGGMVGGQLLDLESEGRAIDLSTLERLQRGKTAALLAAACEMGALCGGADEALRAKARVYGENIGLCFQMVDDMLDTTGDKQVMGKPVGQDGAREKSTYVSLLGLDETRRRARERTIAAVAALDTDKPAQRELAALANALLERTH